MAVINTTYEDFVYGYNNDTLRDGDYRFLYETIVPSTVTAYKASGLQFYITISVTYNEMTATSSFNNLVKQIERVNSADLPGVNLDLWQVYWNETGADGTKGWIYSLKDEWDNIAPYDFKSIQFLDGENYVYTLDDGASGDLSVTQTTLCRDNRIYGSDTKSYAVYSTRDYIQKIILRPDTDADEVKYNNIVYTNQNIIVKGEFNTIYENCNNITLVGDHNTLKAGNDVIDINGNSNTLGENNENITIQGDESILGGDSKGVTIVGNSNQVDESTTVVITGNSNAVSGSTDTTITGQGNTVSGSTTTVIEGNNNNTYDSTQTDVKGDGNTTSDSSGTTIVDGSGNTISGSTDTTITEGDDITINPGNTDTDLDGDDSSSTIDQTDQGKIETKPDGSQTNITNPDDPKETSTDPIQEAPIDNEPYVRRNKEWSKLVAGDNITITNDDDNQTTTISSATGIDDAPSDGKIYGRKDATWTEVTSGTEYTAGQNIGITDNTISALGYTYDADLNSFTTLGDTPKSNAVSVGNNNTLGIYTNIVGSDNEISDNVYALHSTILGHSNSITSTEEEGYTTFNTIVGRFNTTSGSYNTIIGSENTVTIDNSTLIGINLKTYDTGSATGTSTPQTILGKFNKPTSDSFIIGGGSSDTYRKNLLTIDSLGTGTFASDVRATKSDGTTVSLIDVANSSYDDTKVVHKEGEETVSGAKEFTGANTYAKPLRLTGTDWSTSNLQSATTNIYIYPNYNNVADKSGWCFSSDGSFRPDNSNTSRAIGSASYGLGGIYMKDGNSLIRSNTGYLGFGNKNGTLFTAYSTKGSTSSLTDGSLYPGVNNLLDLGLSSLNWRNAYLSGVLHVPTIGTSASNLTLLSGSERSYGGFSLTNTDQDGSGTFTMTTGKTVLKQLTDDNTYSALTLDNGALTLESEGSTTIRSNSRVKIGAYPSQTSSSGYYSDINLGSSIDLSTSYKTASATTTKVIRFSYSNGALYPTSSNTLYLGTSSYRWKYIYSNNALQVSDKREKKDIEQIDLQRCKDWVDNTSAYTFKYNDDEEARQRVGLIAQEVQQYIPEAVVESDDEKKTLSLGYSDLVAPLLAVVKDLRKEVAELKERVAKLEAEKIDNQ